MPNEQEGLTIRFQGKLCSPVFEYTKSVGPEPSRGYVFIEREALKDFSVKELLPEAPASAGNPDAGLLQAGLLEFIEVIDGVEHSVSWQGMLVTERSIEVAVANDDGASEMVKIEVTDLRYLWETRGEPISDWCNMPKMHDADQVSGTQGATDLTQAALVRQSQINELTGKIDLATVDIAGDQATITEYQKQLEATISIGPSSTAELRRTIAQRQNDIIAKQALISKLTSERTVLQLQQAKIGFVPDPVQKSLSDEAAAFLGRETQIQTLELQIAGAKVKVQEAQAGLVDDNGPSSVKLTPLLSLTSAGKAAKAKAVADAKAELNALTGQRDALQASQKLSKAFLEAAGEAATLNRKTGGATTGGIVGLGGELIPSSLDGDKKWTVKTILEKKILPKLPGAPKLAYVSEANGAKELSAKFWQAELPRTALREVLDEFQLIVAWNNDASVSVWSKNEGELQETNGTKFTAKPTKPDGSPDPSVDPRMAHSRDNCTFAHVPSVVVVVGAPRIVAERVRLEACGMLGGDSGQIVPLTQALNALGLTRAQAAKLVLTPHSERAALYGMSDEAIHEIVKWCFKWFRLVGGVASNSGKLPILDSRARIDAAGELLPLRVFSESFTQLDVMQAKLFLIQAKAVSAAAGGGSAAKSFVEHALESLSALKSGHAIQCTNIGFAEASTGFGVNHNQGLIKFHDVQGLVAVEGLSLDESTLLERDPIVELEYAYVKKPSLTDPPALSMLYNSVWVRDANGTAQPRAAVPPGASAITIHRKDFQQIDGADGKTNKPILDEVAKKLAQEKFNVVPSVKGAVVEFCRPMKLINTGSVLSITWQVNDEIPSTTAHVGAFAPLAPKPELRTQGLGDFRLDHLLRGSKIAPRGLAQ